MANAKLAPGAVAPNDFTAFRNSITAPVVETNVPGIYALTALPDDINTAPAVSLLRRGVALRRPDATDPKGMQDAWDKVFKRATPLHLIVPQLSVEKRPYRRTRPTVLRAGANTAFTNAAWAGGVVKAGASGTWVSATGSWTIPTVSQPSESAGTEGGWHCSSWVGIDGFSANGYVNTTDVLQTGIDQTVDARGNTTCRAWFEWFVPPAITGGIQTISAGKTVLETSPFRPSLASIGGRLYLCWRGDGNDQMNIAVSEDGGRSFLLPPLVTGDTSQSAPVIGSANGNLFLAWRGDGNDNLNVAQVTLDPNTGRPTGYAKRPTLGDTSKSAPTIAGLNGVLYLGFRGEGNDNLCVMASRDGGSTWGPQLVVPGNTTPASPALAACNGQLVLSWKGDGNDNLNVAPLALDSNANPTGIGPKTVLAAESPDSPAIAEANGFIFIAWKGDGNDNLNVAFSADNGASFGGTFTSPEKSPQGPALAAHNGALSIAWRGDGNDHLNVAPVGTTLNEPAFRNEIFISNFPVKPGDQVSASITYNGTTSGTVQLSNNTTGQAFSLTLAPPSGANFSGECVEWIVEAPDSGEPTSALPNFSTVTFTDAFGCAAKAAAVANPNNGDTVDVQATVDVRTGAKKTLTKVAVASDQVTVSFIG